MAPKSAPPPFDKADGDVIIRTCDNVEFRVYRNILSLASPFFESMFSLPQPATSGEITQVVPVTETSTTIEALLRICYPIDDPVISSESPTHARDVLEAASKYDIRIVFPFIERNMLSSLSWGQSLLVYTIACKYGLEDLARNAAWRAVYDRAVESYLPELEDMSAGCYYRLLELQRIGCQNAYQIPKFCHRDVRLSDSGKKESSRRISVQPHGAPSPFDSSDADLILESLDMMQFHVYRKVIEIASPVLKNSIWTAPMTVEATLFYRSQLTVAVQLDSKLLSPLLQLCYPASLPHIDDVGFAFSLLDAARKFEMERASYIIQQHVKSFVSADPYRFYFLAASRGLKDHAVQSARLLLSRTIDELKSTYIAELEEANAASYYRLLEFHRRCTTAVGELERSQDHLFARKEFGWWCNLCTNHAPWTNHPSWSVAFKDKTKALLERPSKTTVTGGGMFVELVRLISQCCAKCREADPSHTYALIESLGEKIDEVTAKIDLY
ncbi:hypothetical protein WOLCODRAFT_108504 [Wolfiporia cocos MD-104 SS10]|uniref:BTB domain-containing protein n=1 Tax=Wolfiporia cocos (strain MD-104) TaxID=742152 RepID=A0A2H3J2T4_WOLCO|nr:hypothetical protein WOLCODRAFT_108504 [Wolfiporia cocos MD-104 SS10]